MIDIREYLDVILAESDGETVITAIVGALSSIAEDPKVSEQEIDISEELGIIETNPSGNVVRKAISKALYKLSLYNRYDSDVVVLDNKTFSSLEEKEPHVLYLVHDDSEASLLEVNENGQPIVESNTSIAPLSNAEFSNLRELLLNDDRKNRLYDLILGKNCLMTTIAKRQFKDMSNLRSVKILSSNEFVIKEGAFEGCTNLMYANIGPGVIEIGKNAFRNCRFLKRICIDRPEGSISGAPWGADERQTEIIWG